MLRDPGMAMHWDLRDAGELILHRVLDRDDLLAPLIALDEADVACRLLAAASGASDEEHAVRLGGESVHVCDQLGWHSELGELDRAATAIE